MAKPRFVALPAYAEYAPEEMTRRASEFRAEVARRRTVREYSDRPVPKEVVEE